MEKRNLYTIILAGEENNNLWPLFRKNQSKKLPEIVQSQSLLEQMLMHTSPFVAREHRWILTSPEHAQEVQAVVGQSVGQVVQDSCFQSAAALIKTCLLIENNDPNALVMILPTWYYLFQTSKFLDFLTHAIDFATHHHKITLLGLKAAYPAPEYGYILCEWGDVFPAEVTFFHDQPDKKLCENYFQAGALWNSEIVVSQVGVLLQECKTTAPELFEKIYSEIFHEQQQEPLPEELSGTFEKLVLEKSKHCVVLPVDFIWCSVKNLESFLALRTYLKSEHNVITIDARDNLVEAQDVLVALVGVDNICVVQNDGVLLIVNREHLDKVKLVLEVLKNHNERYL